MRYLGYACIDGAFPGNPEQVKPWTNLYVAWSFFGYWKTGETLAQWLPRMVACVDRAYKLGMWIYVDLDMGRQVPAYHEAMSNRTTVKRILKALLPYDDKIIAISVADEPAIDRATAISWYKKVREVMAEVGMRPHRLAITLTAKQSMYEDVITIPRRKADGSPKGSDIVILELYSAPTNQGEAANMEYVRARIDSAVPRIDPAIEVGFWLQAFNRNGAFKGEAELATLNKQTYKYARDKRRNGVPLSPKIFLAFNWARQTGPDKVGTKWLPLVKQKHKWIAADLGIA